MYHPLFPTCSLDFTFYIPSLIPFHPFPFLPCFTYSLFFPLSCVPSLIPFVFHFFPCARFIPSLPPSAPPSVAPCRAPRLASLSRGRRDERESQRATLRCLRLPQPADPGVTSCSCPGEGGVKGKGQGRGDQERECRREVQGTGLREDMK